MTMKTYEILFLCYIGLSLIQLYYHTNPNYDLIINQLIIILKYINKIILFGSLNITILYFIVIFKFSNKENKKIKNLDFYGKPIEHFQGECSICISNFTDDNFKLNKCNHVFHKKCISEWVISYNKNSCPLCRLNFI